MIFLFLWGCTLDELGAKTEIERLLASDKGHQNCSADTLPIKARPVLPDPTFSGQLDGASLAYKGQEVPVVVALDHSGSMYGGYAPSVPYKNEAFFWEQSEFQTLLEGSIFSFSGQGIIFHSCLIKKYRF